MASVPNFDPGLFVNFDADEFDALPEGALTNFAVQGQYAPASTFKALTYVMAMEEGIAPEGASSVEDEIDVLGAIVGGSVGRGESAGLPELDESRRRADRHPPGPAAILQHLLLGDHAFVVEQVQGD